MTTTRVFFVESSAHWEAIQRERAQFHNSTTSPIQIDKRIISTKPKSCKSIERASLEKRNTLLVGKEGSRRRQRWNNSHLKDNPLAVLHTEDLKLPGYEQSYRPSLWKDNEFDIETLIDNNQEINFNGESDKNNNNDDDDDRFTITKKMRHDIKRHHIPEGYVQLYENEILDFISRQTDKNNNNDDDDDRFTITKKMRHDIKRHHIPEGYVQLYENEILDFISRQTDKNNNNDDDSHTLTWEINDNYHRKFILYTGKKIKTKKNIKEKKGREKG
ncbi:hypothetical protein BJ944DRAFT_19437 [Cunninghamella echinulata]|nr:hypothetical protein BJ944DRAFT_19437 [Cunninghamella echinulata]